MKAILISQQAAPTCQYSLNVEFLVMFLVGNFDIQYPKRNRKSPVTWPAGT
jgi:hypothetical protein